MKNEADKSARLLKELRSRGAICQRHVAGTRTGGGWPDATIVLTGVGVPLIVEFKDSLTATSSKQRLTMQQLRDRCGGCACVVRFTTRSWDAGVVEDHDTTCLGEWTGVNELVALLKRLAYDTIERAYVRLAQELEDER